MSIYSDLALPVPKNRTEIAAIQSERKAVAVERARQSKFWAPRLDGIDSARLDDPDEWAKIPILDKGSMPNLNNTEKALGIKLPLGFGGPRKA